MCFESWAGIAAVIYIAAFLPIAICARQEYNVQAKENGFDVNRDLQNVAIFFLVIGWPILLPFGLLQILENKYLGEPAPFNKNTSYKNRRINHVCKHHF